MLDWIRVALKSSHSCPYKRHGERGNQTQMHSDTDALREKVAVTGATIGEIQPRIAGNCQQ